MRCEFICAPKRARSSTLGSLMQLLQVAKDLRATGRSLDDQLVEKAEPSEFVTARRALGKLLLN